ncbi:MAG: glutaredoxin family protein, partial [Polaromonas sp.]
MTSNTAKNSTPAALFILFVVAGMASSLFSPLSQAQQVYRSVGTDGKVTFSDQPPPPASNAKVSASTASPAGGAASAALPFELRQVASKYPVTLYTGENCTPCGAGRSMLTSRGIPFTEKTVTSNEDIQALQRLSGDTALPFMTIGSQQLKGFSDAEWTQFLNAAGYPPSSVLPASYRPPAATPLVAVANAPTVPAAGATTETGSKNATAARPAGPPAPPQDNP